MPFEDRRAEPGRVPLAAIHRYSNPIAMPDGKFLLRITWREVQARICCGLARYWHHASTLSSLSSQIIADAKHYGKQREEAVLGEKFPRILAHCLPDDQCGGGLGNVSNGHSPLILD
ncbi:hypothetical protein [Rhodanobacter hydrolyticus]|uniref:Uncharacterized protein n=1 Tax=Rhodanobacter hydrolyticus TaxID=2250595 RepID=A0ABW8J244_9GAMM